MALITRCPVCGTRFKVVPDQLRISDGWVRCGECAEVFDASADLSQSEAEPVIVALSVEAPPVYVQHYQLLVEQPAEPSPSPEPTLSVVDGSTSVVEPSPAEQEPSDDAGPTLAPWDPVFDEPVDVREDEVQQEWPEAPPAAPAPLEPPVLSEGLPPQEETSSEEAVMLAEEPVPQSLTEFPADMSTLPEDSAYIAPPPPAEIDAAVVSPRQVSFLKEQSVPEVGLWQRPWVGRGLALLTGLLALTLAGQAAVQQRDQIAASMPATAPLLRALCTPFGCTVQPLRQIDAVVIDSSTFTTVRHGTYRLNLVLKNHAPTEIALPAIELALTDTQEQAVLRRVLLASDMAPAAANIAANGEWTASMELAVSDEASIARIVGYRLLAFYP